VSKYELDDAQVRRLLSNPERLPRALAATLKEQLPKSEPLVAGSRLRCRNGDVYVRWCSGSSHTSQPWTDVMGHLNHPEDMAAYKDLDVAEVWSNTELPA
jgi:hypothetical protein